MASAAWKRTAASRSAWFVDQRQLQLAHHDLLVGHTEADALGRL